MENKSLPATTTNQQDMVVAGQRKINMIWEVTQAFIAIIIVLANMIVGTYQGLQGANFIMPPILSNSMFLVVDFYFSRTNHSAIGGIGTTAYRSE